MTRGRALLCELTGKGESKGKVTGAELSRLLKISGASLFAWQCGRSRPKPCYRDILESQYGIPAESWLTDEERERVEAIKAAIQESAA